MARPIPFNRGGIWGIESVGAPVVGTADVTFNFEDHPNVNYPYNGLLLVRITQAIPSSTTGTFPILFKTGNNASVAVTKSNGAALTAADIPNSGYYLFFYDFRTRTLQAITRIV